MRSVELFAGAGGLAMGVTLAGFDSLAVLEWNTPACDTVRQNMRRGYPLVKDWPLWEGDVRQFDWSGIPEGLDLLAGGPPCQPFSMGGKHKAYLDDRDMFPATVDVVRRLRPKSFIIENVKGLTRPSFANYYQYILLQFEFPEVTRKWQECWTNHLSRLQQQKTSGGRHGELTYNVVPTVVNSADYGIPQKRERVFIIGFRSDLGIEWSFPRQTHSLDALLHAQWITGEYWERLRVPRTRRPALDASFLARVKDLESQLFPLDEQPWHTVRDALEGVPDPRDAAADDFYDHNFQPGARSYKGHTGSPLDLPAKALKAGDHGVPGGENMMVMDDGNVRYFSVRESARIQTFPDGYVFQGSWSESMRQLGNAVPVGLARCVAASVAESLAEYAMRALNVRQDRNAA